MRPFLFALVVCWRLSSLLAAGKTPGIPAGCVVFKRAADAGARLVEYRSYKDFGTTIVVIDGAGDELRLFAGQGPLFIPYPSDRTADRQKVLVLIQLARKTYPDLSLRLTSIEKAWAEQPANKPPGFVVPQPIVQKPAVPQPSNAAGGTEIVTTNGMRYSNAKVTSVDGGVLTISHDDGVARVRIADLPDEAKKKYASQSLGGAEGASAKSMDATSFPPGTADPGNRSAAVAPEITPPPAIAPAPARVPTPAPSPAAAPAPNSAPSSVAAPAPTAPAAAPKPTVPKAPAIPTPTAQNSIASWIKWVGGVVFLILSYVGFKIWAATRHRPAGVGASCVGAEASHAEGGAGPSPADPIADPSPPEIVPATAPPPSFFFACPICHGSVEAQDAWVGNEVPCPTCTASIKVPAPSNASLPPKMSG